MAVSHLALLQSGSPRVYFSLQHAFRENVTLLCFSVLFLATINNILFNSCVHLKVNILSPVPLRYLEVMARKKPNLIEK